MKHKQRMKESRYTLTALMLIFITLKLTGHIDWSWWWVLAPAWIPFSVGVSATVIYIVYAKYKGAIG